MAGASDDPNEVSTLQGDLRIGEFLVRPGLKQVVRLDDQGQDVTVDYLPDKALGVLVYLASHAQQVCERDDILDAVWGEDREAYDRVLDNSVLEIRRALEDDARRPQYVQTVPKRGYRLLQLPTLRPPESEPDDPIVPSDRRGDRSFHVLAPVLLVLACLPLPWLVGAEDSAIAIRVDAEEGLYHRVREALLTDRGCISPDQIRVTRRSLSPELRIQVEARHQGDRDLTTGRVQLGEQTLLAAARDIDSDPLAMKRWQLDVRDAADQALCNSGLLPDTESACLCLEAARPLVPGQRPEKALPLLQRAVALDPHLAAAYDELARAHAILGESEEAEAVLRRGLAEIGSVDSDSALILRRRLAHLLKDFETEWSLLSELGRRYPNDASWIAARAKHLTMYRADCAGALELLSGLPRPLELKAGLEMARAHLYCGQTDDTIAVLQELVAKSPREIEGRKWLVAALSARRRFDEARGIAGEVLALAPDDLESHMLHAWIATATGEFTEATSWALRARDLARWPSDHQRVDKLLSRLALNAGDYERCRELTASLDSLTAPTAAPLGWLIEQHYFRATCLLRLDDVAGAAATLKELRAVEKASDASSEALILALAGDIELRTIGEGGSIDRAVEAFERATELAPVYGGIPHRAGRVLESLGREDLAEVFYVKSRRADPVNPWLNCRLGLLYLRQGRTEEAAELVNQAMEILADPRDSDLWRRCNQAAEEFPGDKEDLEE